MATLMAVVTGVASKQSMTDALMAQIRALVPGTHTPDEPEGGRTAAVPAGATEDAVMQKLDEEETTKKVPPSPPKDGKESAGFKPVKSGRAAGTKGNPY